MVTPISPKVTASAVSGVIAAAILANITLITPDLFAGTGKWSGLIYGLVIAVASTLAGWLKNDPLRTTDGPTVAIVPGPVPSGIVPDLPTAETPASTPTI